jgi:hypothetical protein
MPRWIRFLSCTFTGLMLSLLGFLATAYWWEGGPSFMQGLLNFLPTSAFWTLVGSFGLVAGIALVGARVLIHLTGMAVGLAGFIAGGSAAAVCAMFLVASQGGMIRLWPASAVFALPFALTGVVTTWLWERLD